MSLWIALLIYWLFLQTLDGASGYKYDLLVKDYIPLSVSPILSVDIPLSRGRCSKVTCSVHCENRKACLSFAVITQQNNQCQCILYRHLVVESSDYMHHNQALYYGEIIITSTSKIELYIHTLLFCNIFLFLSISLRNTRFCKCVETRVD